MHGRPSWNGHFEATFLKSGGGDRVTEWQEVTDQLTSILSNFFCLWFEAGKKNHSYMQLFYLQNFSGVFPIPIFKVRKSLVSGW